MSWKNLPGKSCFWLILFLQLGFWGNLSGIAHGTEASWEDKRREIAQELVCLCGCGNMIMETCTCGEATQNKKIILQELKAGKSKEDIFQAFVNRYGEQVLAAPKREGFNWVVWLVVPYLIPVLAAIGLAFLISKWSKRRKSGTEDVAGDVSTHQIPDKYRQQIEDELNKMD